jgi:hypothetical protein
MDFRTKLMRGSFLAILALAFGIAYTQNPLYTANQNTYFLHGLRASGSGFLTYDWMANTVDPFPLFSWIVHWTSVTFTPFAFYLYHAVLLGIYIFCIAGIACKSFDIRWSSSQSLACFLFLIGLHSAALADLSTGLIGKNVVLLVDVGVAQQSLIAHELLPTTFGVLLIVSIYTFLAGRPFLAVFLSALAAAFHSSYAISAMTLILIYAVLLFRAERSKRKAIIVAVLGVLFLLPTLLFVIIGFRPTSVEIFTHAENILAHFRIPQHAEPGRWFNKQALGAIAIMLIGLSVSRKTRAFPILSIAFVVGLLLTFDQIATSSNTLALLFPWRVSTWLLPISWGLIIAWFIKTVIARKWVGSLVKHKRMLDPVIISAIAVLAVYGGWKMYQENLEGHSARKEDSLMRFVSTAAASKQLYLVPVAMEGFRLQTRVPILVDWKTHPYKDAEVIEWYQRLRVAQRFYEANGNHALLILREIRERYGITHVVLPIESNVLEGSAWQLIYRDRWYAVYKISDSGLELFDFAGEDCYGKSPCEEEV